MSSRLTILAAAVMLVLAALPAGRCLALSASNVLVLYNAASPDGQAIAAYYAQVHPGVTLLPITGVGTGEDVSYDTYLNTIRPQVLAALTPSTQCIVTTKGLPLRIDNPRPSPFSNFWQPYSSLESELTRVDTINTQNLMGDQGWSTPAPTGNPLAANPYYYANGSFSTQTYGTRLSSRLDGFTVADVEGAIDRAQHAVLAPAYTFILDNDPTAPAAQVSRMPQLAANLATRGLNYTYDNTTTFITNAPNSPAGLPRQVLGYVSQGVYGGGSRATTADARSYIQTQLAFQPAPGAVFESWESYNAYSFDQGVNKSGMGEVAEWLHVGGTVGVGNVEEPQASLSTVTNEDRMFDMLLNGYTWAEAAWNATRQLSFVNTVVGDPLMTLKPWIVGDVDLDGRVNVNDYLAFLHCYTAGPSDNPTEWLDCDLNGDGKVNVNDYLMFISALGQQQSGTLSAGDEVAALAPAPEPATLALLALGGLALFRRRRGCR